MSDIESAFPYSIHKEDVHGAYGMTLRDYMAGQALVGLITVNDGEYCNTDELASKSYLYADAMLEARDDQ